MDRKDIADILYRGESKRPIKMLASDVCRLTAYIIYRTIDNTLNPPENLDFVSLKDSDASAGLKLIKVVCGKDGCVIHHSGGEIPVDENADSGLLHTVLCQLLIAEQGLEGWLSLWEG